MIMTSRKTRGVSLLELLITVAIGFTFASITFIAMKPLFNQSHLDSAYNTTLMAFRNTRHLAITQSHLYYVTVKARQVNTLALAFRCQRWLLMSPIENTLVKGNVVRLRPVRE